MNVYKDPLPDGKILMGYKGDTLMDAGYFFAPYIPLTNTPTVLPPQEPEPESVWKRLKRKMIPTFRSINEPWEPSQVEE